MTISIRNIFLATLTATVVSSSLLPTIADARPSTRSYSCEGVRDYIYHRGAIVMNTKNRSVYRRFVADRSFCQPRESLKRYYAPTRDGQCSLHICREYDNYKFGRD